MRTHLLSLYAVERPLSKGCQDILSAPVCVAGAFLYRRPVSGTESIPSSTEMTTMISETSQPGLVVISRTMPTALIHRALRGDEDEVDVPNAHC